MDKILTCKFCGKEFRRSWGEFCNPRCRYDGSNLAHLLRRKATFEKSPKKLGMITRLVEALKVA